MPVYNDLKKKRADSLYRPSQAAPDSLRIFLWFPLECRLYLVAVKVRIEFAGHSDLGWSKWASADERGSVLY
jgi:hypothetical protein